ncbi:MogA/MoaB family molybdenum cofactor biosynthesis protein [Natrialbaceae archaeon AArc-T1-2]|uniref:MogA/MoaB family molybdenum cofactor biosynthesis protein n=1 Tax=Natrialbaceae archaeon AArc-T1-2 TaxID=3053904 RepID=UPI00255A8762|nr:molybdopterin-binding protein [Natrialbaceae archaeon AArc-T1-2]WIV68462.1 molybdopterin-binding protein [Natrialbaceae archaeon AArc-T1-2]
MTSQSSGNTVGAAIVTITSEGSLDDDPAGDSVAEAFEADDHEIATRELIARGHDNVQSKVSRAVDRDDVDIVVTVGGTGVEPQDATLEAVGPLLDKDLPAFADLFHALTYDEIGISVVSSRALGGIADGVAIFCLPNDEVTARIASEEIIVPQASRLATLANGTRDEEETET